MTYHVRSHEGGITKPYTCGVCGKGFSRYHVENPRRAQVLDFHSAFAVGGRMGGIGIGEKEGRDGMEMGKRGTRRSIFEFKSAVSLCEWWEITACLKSRIN